MPESTAPAGMRNAVDPEIGKGDGLATGANDNLLDPIAGEAIRQSR
jgi:hypothetical protein